MQQPFRNRSSEGVDSGSWSATIVQKNSQLYTRTLTICLGSLFVGFTLVYYKAMRTSCLFDKEMRVQFCTQELPSYLSATIPGMAIIGSFIVCKLFQKWFSRRWSLIANCILGILGSLLVFISFIVDRHQNFIFGIWISGRILHGVVVGVFMTFCLLIINEYSPVQKKLFVIGIYQLSIELGIALTNILFPIISKAMMEIDPCLTTWNNMNLVMISIAVVPLILQIILLVFVFKQETPQYLIQKGRYQEAKSLITSLYKPDYAIEKYLQLKDQHEVSENSMYEQYDKKAIHRNAIFLGIYAIAAQQMSGVNYLNAIGLYNDNDACQVDEPGDYQMIIVGALPEICQLLGTASLLLFSKITCMKSLIFKSQRKALIRVGSGISCLIMVVVLILEIFSGQHDHREIYWLILQSLFMYSFGLTLGIVCWLYVSQMLNSEQLMIVVGVHWILALINTDGFSLINEKHWVVPLILFSACLIFSILHKRYLIETKNKSKLDIIRILDSFQYCK